MFNEHYNYCKTLFPKNFEQFELKELIATKRQKQNILFSNKTNYQLEEQKLENNRFKLQLQEVFSYKPLKEEKAQIPNNSFSPLSNKENCSFCLLSQNKSKENIIF